VLLYPTPNSVLFYDAIVLNGYLFLNLVIGWNVLEAERNGVHYQSWLKPLIYISIPWAVSIHTVTAYLYCGLPGRHFWLTAILAPRFLASAFAAGPALLILLCLFIRRFTNFDPAGSRSRPWPKPWLTPSASTSFSFCARSSWPFTARSRATCMPSNTCSWACTATAPGSLDVELHDPHAIGIILTVNPATRKNETSLASACAVIIMGTWIDKGLGMISGGFVPNPLHEVNEYAPSMPEIGITLGVYAIGALVLTVLYKMVVGVKEEVHG
jgi:Ni/Fe-hydrogenase subunit HybB-like protein